MFSYAWVFNGCPLDLATIAFTSCTSWAQPRDLHRVDLWMPWILRAKRFAMSYHQEGEKRDVGVCCTPSVTRDLRKGIWWNLACRWCKTRWMATSIPTLWRLDFYLGPHVIYGGWNGGYVVVWCLHHDGEARLLIGCSTPNYIFSICLHLDNC